MDHKGDNTFTIRYIVKQTHLFLMSSIQVRIIRLVTKYSPTFWHGMCGWRSYMSHPFTPRPLQIHSIQINIKEIKVSAMHQWLRIRTDANSKMVVAILYQSQPFSLRLSFPPCVLSSLPQPLTLLTLGHTLSSGVTRPEHLPVTFTPHLHAAVNGCVVFALCSENLHPGCLVNKSHPILCTATGRGEEEKKTRMKEVKQKRKKEGAKGRRSRKRRGTRRSSRRSRRNSKNN